MAAKINCQSCLRDDKGVAATAFCFDCGENMCNDCRMYHKTNRASANHKIYDTLGTDVDMVVVKTLSVLTKCSNHKHEEVKYICKDHNELCCNECAILKHRKCEELQSVTDACRNVDQEGHVTSIRKTLENFSNFADQLLQSELGNILRISDFKSTIQKELEGYKAKLDEAFKSLAENVINEADVTGIKLMTLTDIRVRRIKDVNEHINGLDVEANTVEKYGSSLHKYLHERHRTRALLDIQSTLQRLRDDAVTQDIELIQAESLNHAIDSVSTGLSVGLKTSEVNLKEIIDFDLHGQRSGRKFQERTVSDEITANFSECNCWPRSCIWIWDFVIVALEHNSKLLLFSEDTCSLKFTYNCDEHPWSMTAMDHGQFAVCGLNAGNIEIYLVDKTSAKINRKKTILTKSKATGLSFDRCSKQLVCLSKENRTVYFLSLEGQETYTVPVRDDIKNDLQKAYCIAVGVKTNVIYVSCCDINKVIALTTNGKKLAEMTHVDSESLQSPWEIMVDSDSNVYISNMHRNCVLQCDRNLKVIRKLLQTTRPLGICFNENMTKIALSGIFKNDTVLKLYKFE